MTTVPFPLKGPQHVLNKVPALNTCNVLHIDDNDVINIQSQYDPDWPMELDLWDGNFRHIITNKLLTGCDT